MRTRRSNPTITTLKTRHKIALSLAATVAVVTPMVIEAIRRKVEDVARRAAGESSFERRRK